MCRQSRLETRTLLRPRKEDDMSKTEAEHEKVYRIGPPPKSGVEIGLNGASRIGWSTLQPPGDDPIASPGIAPMSSGPYGRARLAGSREIANLMERERRSPERFLRLLSACAVGHDPHPAMVSCEALPIPMGQDSPNCLIIGRSGAGKTQKGTLPAVGDAIASGHAVVYLNVKGNRQTRIVRKLAEASGRQDEVRLLAPRKPGRTLGFTAIEGCKDTAEAGEVARCMVSAVARNSRSGEGAWAYNQAQEFISHAIAAICTDLPAERQTLPELRQVVIGGNYKAFADAHPRFPVLAKFARYHDNGNHNGGTIAATIGEATAFIDESVACLSANELRLTDFASVGGILVLEVDEHDVERLETFCTIALRRLVSTFQQVASVSPTGALPNKTVIVIDELAAAGPIPGISTALHTCRERGFCIFAGVQSVPQIHAIYGAHAESVLAGFQSQIALGGGLDAATAEYLSRKSGTTTIAVPGFVERFVNDDTVAESQSWTLAPRPLLLPGDIANPPRHSRLGIPATFLLGDGTPPFQAYLRAAYEDDCFVGFLDEVNAMQDDDDRRSVPLISCASPTRYQPAFTITSGWTSEQINTQLDEVMKKLEWDNAPRMAQEQWLRMKGKGERDLAVLLRLAEELAARNATLREFFMSYLHSNTNNLQAILHYLDYARLKKSDDQRAHRVRKDDVPRSPKEAASKFNACN